MGALCGVAALLVSGAAFPANNATADLPAEVRPFVGKSSRAIDVAEGDLNGDGLPDYVLVTEGLAKAGETSERMLTILVRGKYRTLRQVKQNARLSIVRTRAARWRTHFKA